MEHEDFETESRIQGYKLEDGSNFRGPFKLPAKIVVKIKLEEDDDKIDKRALPRTYQKRSKP